MTIDNLRGRIPRDPRVTSLPPFLDGKLINRAKLLDGTIKTYWRDATFGEFILTRRQNVNYPLIYPPASYNPPWTYRAPLTWFPRGAVLKMPGFVNVFVVRPACDANNPNSIGRQWANFISSDVIDLLFAVGHLRGVFGYVRYFSALPYADRSPDLWGRWIQDISPPTTLNVATRNIDTTGIYTGEVFQPFLGCNVLNIVIYQTGGYFPNYGHPFDSNTTFIGHPSDTAGAVFRPGYVYADQLADDEAYWKKCYPYFQAASTFVYYDDAPLEAEEKQIVCVNGGGLYANAPGILTSIDFSTEFFASQQAVLKRICHDLADYGFVYKPPLHGISPATATTLLDDIVAYFNPSAT